MLTFDKLIQEIGSRYHLGPKGRSLVEAALVMIARQPGGIGGFLDRFKAAGLAAEVASWLAGTDRRANWKTVARFPGFASWSFQAPLRGLVSWSFQAPLCSLLYLECSDISCQQVAHIMQQHSPLPLLS
jgi:hypothetical protein